MEFLAAFDFLDRVSHTHTIPPTPSKKMLSSLSRLSSATLATSHTLVPIRTMFVRVTSTPNVAMQRLNEKLSEEGLERLMKARKVCLSTPPLALPALGWCSMSAFDFVTCH